MQDIVAVIVFVAVTTAFLLALIGAIWLHACIKSGEALDMRSAWSPVAGCALEVRPGVWRRVGL